jgi:hypothetical protein
MRIKGGTIKINKSTSRFAEISKASIKKDLQHIKKPEEKKPEVRLEIEEGAERRIIQIKENGEYSRYAKLIVGKLVKLIRKSMFGNSWYCEFVFDEDRKALNSAAGWSDKTSTVRQRPGL